MKHILTLAFVLLFLASGARAYDEPSSASTIATQIKTQSGCSTAGYVWVPSSNSCVAQSGGGGTPGGSTGQIQYNNAGTFGGLAAVPVANGGTGLTAPSIVSPETYGAKGNGGFYFDGAFSDANNTVNSGAGSTTTPTTSPVTTVSATDYVLSILATQSAWTAAPSSGTIRVNGTYNNGYLLYLSDNLVSAAGTTTTAISGTSSSANMWNSASIALAPSTGNSISFVASATSSSNYATALTLNKPTGTTSGDYLVACFAYSYYGNTSGPQSDATPSAWNLLTAYYSGSTSNGAFLQCYGHVASVSEPTSYTFNRHGGSTNISGFIADYRGTSGPDSPVNTLTSASANFTSAAVGNPICIGELNGTYIISQASYSNQMCGTITGFNSSTSVQVSLPSYKSLSGLPFAYGNDDTAAFTTMLTTAPCSTVGCKVQLQSSRYVLTGTETLPANIPISIYGTGPGTTNTANSFYFGVANANNGSALIYLTQSMTSPGITMTGGSTVASTTATDTLQDFTMYGGAGDGLDGAGNDGIDIVKWQGSIVRNVMVFNFTGWGAQVIPSNGYTENNDFEHFFSSYNGAGGLGVGVGANDGVETVACEFCIIEANGGPAVQLGSAALTGFVLSGSTIQWNNRFGANPEIYTSGIVAGGFITGNYIAVETNFGSLSTSAFGNTAGMVGLAIGSNNYDTPSNAVPLTFSASGTPIPACTSGNRMISSRLPVLVGDATQCTNGATYASGGTTSCTVTCNGTNWIESGGAQINPAGTITSSATPAIVSTNGTQVITLSANATPTVTGIAAGQRVTFEICQPSGGPYTWTWPASIHGGMNIGATASTCSIQSFDSYNGTTLVAENTGITNVAP